MRKQRRSGRFLFLRRGEERDKERSSAKREYSTNRASFLPPQMAVCSEESRPCLVFCLFLPLSDFYTSNKEINRKSLK